MRHKPMRLPAVGGKIRNTGSVDATLYVAYVVPKGSPLSDPTADAPTC